MICQRCGGAPGRDETCPACTPLYADTVDHVKIYHDDGGWFLDGRDRDDRHTRMRWSYDSWAKAMADVRLFIDCLRYDNRVRWVRRERLQVQTVVFHWFTAKGYCSDCGLPAAYRIGSTGAKVCSVDAAYHAAYGDTLTFLYEEESHGHPIQ